jgi:hypothetical protein
VIPWKAGLDPEGGIPVYTVKKNAVTDYGADPTGVTDATTAINNCLKGVVAPGACFLPTGTYLVTGEITMTVSEKVLRGNGPGNTILNLGAASAHVSFDGGSKPSLTGAKRITSGLTKGSTSLTLSNVTGLAIGDWVSLTQENEAGVVNIGDCRYCGYDNGTGQYARQQFAKITNIAGTVITINRPLYYTMTAGLNPIALEVTFGVVKAGLENLRLKRTVAPSEVIVYMQWTRHSWLKNIETGPGGNNTGDGHITIRWSHGIEVRDSYVHDGYGFASGQNYGIEILQWNSDHKIENNIIVGTRHAILGAGGAGVVVLYNYIDSGRESEDLNFLSADMNPNHGAHPTMWLIEGNSSAKITWDETHGSSSHNVGFRNHARLTRTTPAYDWGQWGIDVQATNRSMSLLGNVIGTSAVTSGTVIADGACSPTEPTMFRFGCDGQPGSYTDATSRTTTILHGNYDFVTDGVATWDGGADHTLPSSLYYGSKPSFFGGCPWPVFGPDASGIVGVLPAKERYKGVATCTSGAVPAAPSNLTVTQP